MHRTVILNQVTLCADGSIALQMLKQVINDDGTVFASEPHRTALDPDTEVSGQMSAVNAHPAAMGWPAVNADDLAHVETLKATHRNFAPVKARVEDFKKKRAAAAEAARAAELAASKKGTA